MHVETSSPTVRVLCGLTSTFLRQRNPRERLPDPDDERIVLAAMSCRGGSEEEVEEKLRSMRGQTLYLKVIEMNRRRNRLILSERAAAQERRAQQKDRLLSELQAGVAS